MRIPHPVTSTTALRFHARPAGDLDGINARNPDDAWFGALVSWWRNGKVCYRLADDLLEALLLTDLPTVPMVPPHATYWIDLEGQTDLLIDGEPVAGVFMTVIRNSRFGDRMAMVATTNRLADGSHNHVWCYAEGLSPGELDDEERLLTTQLMGIATLVTFYLMDPSHEETPEQLHGNSEWRKQLRALGVKDAEQQLPLMTNRVLGANYRLPADAHDVDGSGRRLGLRHPVRGHIRMQPVGEGRQELRATWIRPHWRGKGDSAAARVVEVVKPELPSPTPQERSSRVKQAMDRFRKHILAK